MFATKLNEKYKAGVHTLLLYGTIFNGRSEKLSHTFFFQRKWKLILEQP